MDLLVLIAKAADVCLKPWSHAVVLIDPAAPEQIDDLHVRIECRDGDGQRCSAPQDAAPLEALGRRLRALVQPAS